MAKVDVSAQQHLSPASVGSVLYQDECTVKTLVGVDDVIVGIGMSE